MMNCFEVVRAKIQNVEPLVTVECAIDVEVPTLRFRELVPNVSFGDSSDFQKVLLKDGILFARTYGFWLSAGFKGNLNIRQWGELKAQLLVTSDRRVDVRNKQTNVIQNGDVILHKLV